MKSLEDTKKKVAIVGFAESWKLAPFDDPSVEVWGLNELWKYVPRFDRWFEVHDADTLGVSKRDLSEGEQKRHLEWLKKDHGIGKDGHKKPIYMQPEFCDGRFPNAVPWPLNHMSDQFKRKRYFTSSIAMMIGQAIVEKYDWIGLFGIDLASDIEYKDQRPCAEYYVGVADGISMMGGGCDVYLAPTSAMCKAGHVYAFEKPLFRDNPILDAVGKHLAQLKKKHEETLAIANTLDGAIQECDNFFKLHDYKERGCDLPTY